MRAPQPWTGSLRHVALLIASAPLALSACNHSVDTNGKQPVQLTAQAFLSERANERTAFRASIRNYALLFGGCPRVEIPEDKSSFDELSDRFAEVQRQYSTTPLSFDFEAALMDANYINAQRMATIRCGLGTREPTDRDRMASKELIRRAEAAIEAVEQAGETALAGKS